MILDKNTILTLNKDPKSIDLHNLALAGMKNVKIDSSIKHDFIADRARDKKIENSDEMYEKLNELERNGILDIWIKKFGKDKYRQKIQESIEISSDILLENGVLKLILDPTKIVEEMGIGTAGFMSAGSGPAITMNSSPSKKTQIIKPNPYQTEEKTSQDPGASSRGAK